MRVAIIGAGLAGLALAKCLFPIPGISITLFDKGNIEQGASGVSTGLLHPFPGKRATLSQYGKEAMRESAALLAEVERFATCKIYERSGVFRPAVTKEQQRDFQRNAIPGLSEWQETGPFGSGLWIPSGITVYARRYLKAFSQFVQTKGVQFVQAKISSLQELEDYDQIAVTAGFETLDFPECGMFPLHTVKGQALLCGTAHFLPHALPHALSSYGHISPTEDATHCFVGSTYERKFKDSHPDPERALPLLQQVSLFYPEATSFRIIDLLAGVRIFQPNSHLPLVQRINPKTIVFTGLGSRGLLYHALFAQQTAALLH